jgi:hypothetical protein
VWVRFLDRRWAEVHLELALAGDDRERGELQLVESVRHLGEHVRARDAVRLRTPAVELLDVVGHLREVVEKSVEGMVARFATGHRR